MKDNKKSAADYARDFRKIREQAKLKRGELKPPNPRINEDYKPRKK